MPVTKTVKLTLTLVAAAALVGAGALIATVRSGKDSTTGSTTSTTSTATVVTTTTTTTRSTVAPGGLPLGELTPGGATSAGCPTGFDCSSFEISCPGIDGSTQGELAERVPSNAHGVVVFFSGEKGDHWWALGRGGPSAAFFDKVSTQGLGLVQVRWPDGWIVAHPGSEPGPAVLACAPATATQWIHDHVYSGIASAGHPGVCGFCVTGNSGGSTQVAYTLTRYGLAPLVDGAILTSGPPHTSLDVGCGLGPSGTDPALLYEPSASNGIDVAYGGAMPCSRHDASFKARLAQDSVDGIPAPNLASVHLRVLVGADDHTSAPSHAQLFADWLGGVEVTKVPGMGHSIGQFPSGLDALAGALSA